jgi:hypothetical protein
VQFDDALLLIEPQIASAYEAAQAPVPPPAPPATETIVTGKTPPGPVTPGPPGSTPPGQTPTSKPKHFHGSAEVAPAAAKMRLVQIAEEIIAVLTADPNADVKIRVEIEANFPNGAEDQTKRAVSENAKTLGFGTAEWEWHRFGLADQLKQALVTYTASGGQGNPTFDTAQLFRSEIVKKGQPRPADPYRGGSTRLISKPRLPNPFGM